MSSFKKFLLIALVIPGLLIPALWYLAVPLDVLTSRARFSLGDTEAQFLLEGPSKGLPFTVTADRLILRSVPVQPQKPSFEMTCTSFQGSLPMGRLFSLSPEVVFSCSAYRGRISGTAGMTSPREIVIRGEEIEFSETPFSSLYGMSGKGTLSFEYRGSSGGGEMRFQISDARIESALLPRSFPLQDFRTIRGVLDVKRKGADIRSLTLESPGIFARIKGHVGDSTSLVIELMMDNPATLDPVYAKTLGSYVVSPGYWSIPFTLDRTQAR